MNKDILHVCRLCLTKSDKNIAIFGDDGIKNNIQSKIWRLFSLMVQQEDNLPKHVCSQCWRYLDFIFSFIARVEEAQKKMFSSNYDASKTEMEIGSIEHYLANDHSTEAIFSEVLSAPMCTEDQSEEFTEPLPSSPALLPLISDQGSSNHVNSTIQDQNVRDESDLDFLDDDSDNSADEDYGDKPVEHYVSHQAARNETLPVQDGDSDSLEFESRLSSPQRRRPRHSESGSKAIRETKQKRNTSQFNSEKSAKKGKSSWNPRMDEEIESFYDFVCELCTEKPFKTFNLLCKHYKSEHSIEGYLKCCKRKMYCRSHLYNHMILHTQPELYKCPQCDKQLCSPVNLKQHLQLFHLPKTELPYRCSMCVRGFATKAAVENHEKLQHILSKEEKFVHVCDVCGKRFSSAPGVTEHKKQVHAQIKPLLCDICAKAFPNRSRLRKHMSSHNDSENLKCPHCDRRLKNYGRLQVHLKCHQGVIHMCPHCDKTYPTRRLIQRHIKTHSDERPHACSVCGKRYRESSHLKMHFNQHTGALPFNCQWCPKRFSASGPFYTHRKKMHPEELARANAEASTVSGN